MVYNQNMFYKIRLFDEVTEMNKQHILVIFSLIYIFVGISVNYLFCIKIYDSVTEYYKSHSYKVLGAIREKFENLPSENIENPEILDGMFDLNDGYGFVYRDNLVVYEINIETTKLYKDSTTRELFNDYSQESGTNLADDITNFIFREEGTEFLTKNNDYGLEMVTWNNVEIYDKSYVIGISLPVKSILESENYYLYRNLFALGTIIIYILVTMFLVIRNRKAAA